ncbi:unnamed protein product [Phyllotreta striolata]|uniref:J domain-containing protein n=1 Tax=Phyllotreta striolata TaxID=444603 RepID=A0A9N9XNR0_PHYSR|nr:unnamed protein product [Phyllotreta striolata]
MRLHYVPIVIYLLLFVQAKKRCRRVTRVLDYYKLKSCYRSTLPSVYRTYANQLEDCVETARQKRGLAFNFSPPEARSSSNYIATCQILECPETANSSTLIEDVTFDYYSAYGNWTATRNASCVRNIGLFVVTEEKHGYYSSISACQSLGADLADVTSQTRSRELSKIINNSLDGWYKVAYVGLDDVEQRGRFVNAVDLPLSCTAFRAWAPGHPVANSFYHHCVVLDDDNLWRVVDCRRKLRGLCEFYPERPESYLKLCQNVINKGMKLAKYISLFSNGIRHLATVSKPKSYYEALGLTPNATQTEIKSAYYKLSMIYHPDKNKDEVSHQKFRDITEAYETLGNTRTRKMYDRGLHIRKDDARLHNFHKSSETKEKYTAPSGKTPVYDFDEWAKAHYETAFRRKAANKRRYAEYERMRQVDSNSKKYETISFVVTMAIITVLLFQKMDYDQVETPPKKVVVVEQTSSSNEDTSKKS